MSQAWAEGTSVVPSAWCSMRRRRTWTVPKTVLKVNGVVPRQMIPWPCFAVPLGQDEFGVGLFDGVLEEAAFEHLAAAFDARFEASGEVGILLGHGQFQAELGLKDQALVLDLDWLGGDRSLKLLRGTHGDVLRWRGGVAMRALLPIPSQILQIRAQTGDRQAIFSVPRSDPEYRLQAEAGDADRLRPGLQRRPLLDQGSWVLMVCSLPSLAVRTFILRTLLGAALAMIHAKLPRCVVR